MSLEDSAFAAGTWDYSGMNQKHSGARNMCFHIDFSLRFFFSSLGTKMHELFFSANCHWSPDLTLLLGCATADYSTSSVRSPTAHKAHHSRNESTGVSEIKLRQDNRQLKEELELMAFVMDQRERDFSDLKSHVCFVCIDISRKFKLQRVIKIFAVF